VQAAAVAVAALAALGAPPAHASEVVGYDAHDVRLRVTSDAAAVSFRSAGALHQVLASGAIGARPPSLARPQIEFRLGGGSLSGAGCGRYDGPPLAWVVAACRAPDGSYWALQTWQRSLPDYGLPPTQGQRQWELRLSHWRGPLAVLRISVDWSYRRFDHLYGSLTYRARPVYGFRATPAGSPLDAYGRNVFVDTFDSEYGGGWRRENSFLVHKPHGVFCYGFYPHAGRPPGAGTRYRATVIGPGVTPDVTWEGPAPGPYDADRDRAATEEQRALFRGERLCRPR
jgi:hypothetical protein